MENKRIFIGNISHDMTKDELAELLGKYGTVETLKMGKADGYALALMSSPEENEVILAKLEGMKVKGRELHTSLELTKREARKKARKGYEERGIDRKTKTDSPRDKRRSSARKKPGEERGAARRINERENKGERKSALKAGKDNTKPSRKTRKTIKPSELSQREIKEIESHYPENRVRRKDKKPKIYREHQGSNSSAGLKESGGKKQDKHSGEDRNKKYATGKNKGATELSSEKKISRATTPKATPGLKHARNGENDQKYARKDEPGKESRRSSGRTPSRSFHRDEDRSNRPSSPARSDHRDPDGSYLDRLKEKGERKSSAPKSRSISSIVRRKKRGKK